MSMFHTADGYCTVYALACGYLDSAVKGTDRQHVTMGAEGAVYFVKCRGDSPVWETFERNPEGRKEARKLFNELIKREKAIRNLPMQ